MQKIGRADDVEGDQMIRVQNDMFSETTNEVKEVKRADKNRDMVKMTKSAQY